LVTFRWWALGAGIVTAGVAVGLAAWGVHAERSYQKERHAHLSECGNNFVTVTELLEGDELQPGDLIEFRRRHYQHWGIYIGNGKVIHVTNSGLVKAEDLVVVGEGGYCRVNLLEQKAKQLGLERRGTRREIVEYAMQKVLSKIQYDLHLQNCEHFVTECFYGKSFSGQQELLDRNSTIKHMGKLGAATFPYE